jgi:hypothetical protein
VTTYIIIPRWFIPGKFVLCILWLLFIYAWWSFLSYFAALLTLKYLTPDVRLSSYLEIILSQGIFGAFRLSSISDYLLDFIFGGAAIDYQNCTGIYVCQKFKMKLELKIQHWN